jgi:hypothetical protein
MEHCRSLPYPDHETVVRMLEAHHGAFLDRVALDTLASAIMPYLARTRLPLPVAVLRIAKYYQRDGEYVGRLMTSLQAQEWDEVLKWIIDYASKQAKYPRDTEAVSAPDLDAYDDIRQKISTYNFEGSFESWLTVTVVSRIQRYWRDRQTLSAGGNGIKSRAERIAEQNTAQWHPAPNQCLSLEMLWPVPGTTPCW